MKATGRRFSWAVIALGIAVILGTAALARDRIREEYWIWRLGRAAKEEKPTTRTSMFMTC